MNIKTELKKLTIINRMIEHRIKTHPTCYLSFSDRVGEWHNTRAFLINKLEQNTGYLGIVEFVNGKAEFLNRESYLADHDRLYDLYRSGEKVDERDIPRLYEEVRV